MRDYTLQHGRNSPLYPQRRYPHHTHILPSSSTSSMSSSSSHSVTTFPNFQNLFDAALSAYREKTGKNVATDQLTVRLLRCDSSDAVLSILQEKAHVFDQHGNGDWDVEVVSLRRLKSIVDILLGISTSGVFGEEIGLVRITKSAYPLQIYSFRRGCQRRK